MRNSMDYIYTSGEQKIVIEVEQKSVRQSVAEQYVRSRKMQGLTQAELAKRAGVPRSNITRFESGNYNPSLEMMVRIAEAFGNDITGAVDGEGISGCIWRTDITKAKAESAGRRRYSPKGREIVEY